jgi:short-subunit dehydrogenase
MDFGGKIVLITGASQGIGRRLAGDFAKRGATVVGCGRSRERLQETLDEIRAASPMSTVIACDVGDRAQVRAMVEKTIADFGKIDILINNAGIGMRRPFIETPLDTVEEIMRTNFLGMVYCTHEVLPSMVTRGDGHIVNISSGSGHIGTLNMAAYCASKFAMNGFSESLYHELRALGIYVSVVSPGPVQTDFSRLFADVPPKTPPSLAVTPQAVSRAVIRAIERQQFEVVVPRWLASIYRLKRIAPNLFRAAAERTFRRHVVGKERHGI